MPVPLSLAPVGSYEANEDRRDSQHAASCVPQEQQRIMFLLYVNRIPSRAGSSSLKIAAELGDRVRLLVSLPSFDRDFLVSGTRILDNAGHEPRPLL